LSIYSRGNADEKSKNNGKMLHESETGFSNEVF
jgi:hypothetical protein